MTDPHPSHPIALAPPAISLALVDLAECVCAELAVTGAGPTCWCGLYPGEAVSWEYCENCGADTCGMGYVRLAGVFPYDTFPLPTIDERCVRPLAWAVEVGALRCVPQPASGELLDPVSMSEVVLRQTLDAAALHRAMKCCGQDIAVERYVPVGPAGACVGGFWVGYLALV